MHTHRANPELAAQWVLRNPSYLESWTKQQDLTKYIKYQSLPLHWLSNAPSHPSPRPWALVLHLPCIYRKAMATSMLSSEARDCIYDRNDMICTCELIKIRRCSGQQRITCGICVQSSTSDGRHHLTISHLNMPKQSLSHGAPEGGQVVELPGFSECRTTSFSLRPTC